MATYLTAFNQTGNNSPNISLTSFNQRLCRIYGSYGLGLSIGKEIGIKKSHKIFNSSYCTGQGCIKFFLNTRKQGFGSHFPKNSGWKSPNYIEL